MPRLPINPLLQRQMYEVARRFRKEPTASEHLLWQALRNKQCAGRKFRRQQPIGGFIVDFLCADEKLIIEVDGEIHAAQREADAERQHLLEQAGYRVLRFTANQVESQRDAVLATITALWNPKIEN